VSTRKPSLEVTQTTLAALSSCDGELWPMTLTFEFEMTASRWDSTSLYISAKGHLVQTIFSGHTHTTDRLLNLDH